MDMPEVEAIVGRLYLAVVDLQKQNQQLKEILDKVGEASTEAK